MVDTLIPVSPFSVLYINEHAGELTGVSSHTHIEQIEDGCSQSSNSKRKCRVNETEN